MNSFLKFSHKIQSQKPFTDKEAWLLFRAAAFGEAVGWTLLISGILYGKTDLPLHDYVLPIAGQLHGLLFLGYFAVTLGTFSSLRWGYFRLLVAGIAGVLPYGTLLFELYAAHVRKHHARLYFLAGLFVNSLD